MSTVKKVKKITKSVKKDGGEMITTETSTTISSTEGGEMERSKEKSFNKKKRWQMSCYTIIPNFIKMPDLKLV